MKLFNLQIFAISRSSRISEVEIRKENIPQKGHQTLPTEQEASEKKQQSNTIIKIIIKTIIIRCMLSYDKIKKMCLM